MEKFQKTGTVQPAASAALCHARSITPPLSSKRIRATHTRLLHPAALASVFWGCIGLSSNLGVGEPKARVQAFSSSSELPGC